MYFYPRSPCGERPHSRRSRKQHHPFLSTLSLRRATVNGGAPLNFFGNFYPRSPCGERHDSSALMKCQVKFLSTLSLRRATYDTYAKVLRVNISIHALLAESDRPLRQLQSALCDFYPRSPCGERPIHNAKINKQDDFYPRSPCGERRLWACSAGSVCLFLSTLSLRRAT